MSALTGDLESQRLFQTPFTCDYLIFLLIPPEQRLMLLYFSNTPLP